MEVFTWIAEILKKWKPVTTLLIFLLIFIINVKWKRVEGDFFPEKFFLTDFKVIKPDYLDVLADQVTNVLLVLIIWMESNMKVMRWVFGLFVCRLVDYLIEGGYGWFHWNGKLVSFDSLLIIVFGIIFINKLWETSKLGY